MKKILIITAILFIILLIHSAGAFSYAFEINLSYDRYLLNQSSVNVVPLTSKIENVGAYHAEIISIDNKTLNRTYFSIPELFVDSFDQETGEAYKGNLLRNAEFTLQVPYYENAKEVKIYDFYDFEMLSIPVSQFSKNLCGDGVCQRYENAKECPSDCTKPAVTEEKPLTEKIAETAQETASNPWFWAVVVGIVFVIFIIVLIAKSKRKQEKPAYQPLN